MYHMIFIYGTLVTQGEIIAQNDKKLIVVFDILGAIHYMVVICDTQV